MTKNLGTADKIVRLFIAVVIAGLYFAKMISGPLAAFLLILAGIFILTSLVGFCPLYTPFKVSTRKMQKH